MRAIVFALAATVSTYAASPDNPVRELPTLANVQFLSISGGILGVASFLHPPYIRLTYTTYNVIAVTPIIISSAPVAALPDIDFRRQPGKFQFNIGYKY